MGGWGAGLAACLLAAAAGALPAPPPRPPGCRSVAPGTDLQRLLDGARAGEAFCLEDGAHPGPLRVAQPLTLWGSRAAVIQSQGEGSTVRLEAPGSALLGLTVNGSGGRFERSDAAVRVAADGVRVEGVRIEAALFGILVERARAVTLRANEVAGRSERTLGLRGDSIRLWEVRDSLVEDNRVWDGRDVVVWYSQGNRIAGNQIRRGRYGTHLMYSHENELEDNRYEGNVVGIFVMYSRGVRVRRNVLALSGGAAGIGLGAKESGDLEIVANLIASNTTGLFLDTSPFERGSRNRIEQNVLLFCDAALVFHGSAAGNEFLDNDFRANRTPVQVEGRGDALDAVWRGNYFDDYAGYDLDGDGFGDVPYEFRSLAQAWVASRPALAFFRGAPALALVEFVGRAVPLFQAPRLLVDPQPRMQGLALEALLAH